MCALVSEGAWCRPTPTDLVICRAGEKVLDNPRPGERTPFPYDQCVFRLHWQRNALTQGIAELQHMSPPFLFPLKNLKGEISIRLITVVSREKNKCISEGGSPRCANATYIRIALLWTVPLLQAQYKAGGLITVTGNNWHTAAPSEPCRDKEIQ